MYQDRADFPVHFPASVLDKFWRDKGMRIENFDLYGIMGISGYTIIMCQEINPSSIFSVIGNLNFFPVIRPLILMLAFL